MLIRTDILKPWKGERLKGVLYPKNIEALWTEAELLAIELVREVPFVVPDGFRKLPNSCTWDITGQQICDVEAIPAPTQEEIDTMEAAMLDGLLSSEPLSKILLNLASASAQPLTEQEFRDWVGTL
jgi:hypothetical protein